MSRRYESGASKRKRQKEQKDIVKRLKPITSFGFAYPEQTSSTADTEDSDALLGTQEHLSVTPSTSGTQEHLSVTPSTSRSTGTEASVSPTKCTEASVCSSTDFIVKNDVGLWTTLSNEEISYWIEKGPSECQHWDGPFTTSKRAYKNQTRSCSRSLFFSTKINGETYPREWLVYSPTKGKVYCFVRKLFSKFSKNVSSTTALASSGFDNWSHPQIIKTHQNSKSHMDSMLTYLTRKRGQTLTTKLDEQIKAEQEYWRHVLQRVMAVICLLAERGLAFRGDDETFGSPNNGNFLGLLELIAKFDPFLRTHINQYGNKGSGHPSYLSKTICEEVIQLMAKKVLEEIVKEIKEAGYFSVSVDSTPDVSNVDQLTVIVRYVSPLDGIPVERFLTFIELKNHTGEGMAELILNFFEELEIDFSKCRGQSYDNAANMAGKYNGVQQKILEKNKFAKFIPCAGHSLNLVGRAAVDSCLDAVNFFGVVNELYCFFSASTRRWAVLKNFLPPESKVLQHLSDTRWEAHARATTAISESYAHIVEALSHIHDDDTEKGDTRRQAQNLLQKMEEFEFVFMLHLWTGLLEQFHKVSNALQSAQISLTTCANLYSSLLQFVSSTRENFDEIEEQAKTTLPDVEYRTVQRRRRVRKRQNNDGSATEALDEIPPRDKFRINSFIPVIDALHSNLDRRAIVYRSVADNFSFLIDLQATREQILHGVKRLEQEYPKDVDLSLIDELLTFHLYVKQAHAEKESFSHQDMYQIIKQEKIQAAFPNVETIFRLFLCLMVTNCSGERSFSRLKRIKNDLRSTMSQERLSGLSILCIENDKLRLIDFDEIIDEFAARKARRKMF